MKKYQYQIIRYMHDRGTGEFVNVGIILYQPESKFLKAKTINKYSRVSHFFGEVNGKFLINNLKQFEIAAKKFEKEINLELSSMFPEHKSIESITKTILPVDDSALYCSDVKVGIDISPDAALSDLFHSLVEKYNSDTTTKNLTDEDIWRKVYKNYFDQLEISKKLEPHVVKTNSDTITFDKAWKNGQWHCFQTLNFDLKTEESVKNKTYRWSGILRQIKNSKEDVHVYLLTSLPKGELRYFVQEVLGEEISSGRVSLVNEGEAESFAKRIRKEIENHEQLH